MRTAQEAFNYTKEAQDKIKKNTIASILSDVDAKVGVAASLGRFDAAVPLHKRNKDLANEISKVLESLGYIVTQTTRETIYFSWKLRGGGN